MSLKQLVNNHEDYLIETRQYLHRHPELSGQEVATSKFLQDEVKKYNLPIIQASKTGFIAILDTGKAGKTIGLRADIDALPIFETEENLKQERIVRSENPGVMHACGHDAHMAMLLTSMKILVEIKDQLSGKIIFIFEEGEEQWTGIYEMVETLKDYPLDAVYGMHVYSDLEAGKIAVDPGPVMAGAVNFQLTVHGKSGHVGLPERAISPIYAGADIVNKVVYAWENELQVSERVSLGIAQFTAGEDGGNVIPGQAVISGSLRSYAIEEARKGADLIEAIAEKIGNEHDCRISFTTKNKPLFYPVDNDEHLARTAQNALKKNAPEALITDKRWFASESFPQYGELAPTVFAFVGIKNEAYGSGAEHHNEYFDIDDKGLKYGVLAEVGFVVDMLSENND